MEDDLDIQTNEELEAEQLKKERAEEKQRIVDLEKKIFELTELVVTKNNYTETVTEYDNTIDHLCHTCNAVSMGKFNSTEQAKFNELKDQSSTYKKSRPLNFQQAVRKLFINSVKCNAENCPFTKEDEFLIEEYIQLRESIETNTLLYMQKKGITRYPPLGL